MLGGDSEMDTRYLPVVLTQVELDERRDKLAQRVRDLAQAEQEAKDEAAERKEAIKAIEKEMSLIAREIREKAEIRPVEVRKEVDVVEGIEETVRTDTGKVIETRALAPHERQTKLFAIDAAISKEIVKKAAAAVNAGELGPNVTATVK